MEFGIAWLASVLFFVLPSWVANSSPVLLGGAWPIDWGKDFFDGRRIFGKGKTWLGLAAGISCGTLCAVLLAYFLPGTEFAVWGDDAQNYVIGGILLSCGAMAGDLAGSFFKRRLGQGEGSPSFVLDQLAFISIALLFAWQAHPAFLTWENAAALIAASYVAHRLANWWAHSAGLKKVPW